MTVEPGELCPVCGKMVEDYIYLGDGLALLKPCDCTVDMYSNERRGILWPEDTVIGDDGKPLAVDSQPPTSGSDQQ